MLRCISLMDDKIESFVCRRCGTCCRGDGFVRITIGDARRIAEFLGVSVQEFYFRYTMPMNQDYWLKDSPGTKDCIFLENNLCIVHPVKPQQCQDFPRGWHIRELQFYCPGLHSCLYGEKNPPQSQTDASLEQREE